MRHNMQLPISLVTLPCKERVKLQLSATPRIKISIGLQLALTSHYIASFSLPKKNPDPPSTGPHKWEPAVDTC